MLVTPARLRFLTGTILACWFIASVGSARAELTLRLADYATAPKTGATGSEEDPIIVGNDSYLARVNFMAEEPGGGRNRFFVNDLNGPLYILDQTTRNFTEYLNFDGRGSEPGLFDRLYRAGGFATGLVSFQFDPDYANNGKFYTIHVEQGNTGSQTPSNASYPNLDISNYGVTPSVDAPGTTAYRNVLVEWTDTNTSNVTFEGSVRELLRISARDRIHPMGDIIFNPTADSNDPDWRVMYVAIGDAGNGEQSAADIRPTPQMLSAFGGKIIRIMPDNAGTNTSGTLGPNGKYYIPNDNPFTGVSDSSVRDEIYALGLRNPHRMSWDVDPDNAANNYLIVNDIGLATWEEVNIIHAGANYGYSAREGNQQLFLDNTTGPIPSPDQIPVYITDEPTSNTVTPLYPVVQYGHGLEGQGGPAGDSISSGFVYRGSNIPSLSGKYIFGDITTGQLFWSDFAEMLTADDGDPETLAAIHSIDIAWDNPNDIPDLGEELYSTATVTDPVEAILGPLHQIVERGYEARGGTDPDLPGGANITGGFAEETGFGRADIRIQVDDDGELYILSKSDGMIRYIVEAIGDADFDNDGDVDGRDFLAWQRGNGDADGDGIIGAADLIFWQQQYGIGSLVAESTAVPEPTTGMLMLVLCTLAATTKRTFT
jgi:hypothetical protein